jgi:hypothetical protein
MDWPTRGGVVRIPTSCCASGGGAVRGQVESYAPLADTSTGTSGHGFSAGLGFALLHRGCGLDTKAWVIACGSRIPINGVLFFTNLPDSGPIFPHTFETQSTPEPLIGVHAQNGSRVLRCFETRSTVIPQALSTSSCNPLLPLF